MAIPALESVDVQETLRMLASRGAIGVAIITPGPHFYGALEDIVLLILGLKKRLSRRRALDPSMDC